MKSPLGGRATHPGSASLPPVSILIRVKSPLGAPRSARSPPAPSGLNSYSCEVPPGGRRDPVERAEKDPPCLNSYSCEVPPGGRLVCGGCRVGRRRVSILIRVKSPLGVSRSRSRSTPCAARCLNSYSCEVPPGGARDRARRQGGLLVSILIRVKSPLGGGLRSLGLRANASSQFLFV